MISRVHRAPGVAGFTQSLSLKILRPAHYRALLPWSVVALASLFASMASTLIAELKGAGDVLAAHVSAGLAPDVVLKTLCTSLSERIRNTWVKDAATAKAISDAVAAGPWPPSQKKELASIVLSASVKTEKQSKSLQRKSMQKVPKPENLLTESDWAKIRSPDVELQVKLAVLANRLWLLGIVCPSEPVLFRLTGLIALNTQRLTWSQEIVKTTMQTLREAIKAIKGPREVEVPHLEHYPVLASELPPDIIQSSYGGSWLPVPFCIPELDGFLAGMKQRIGTHKAPDWLQHVPQEYRASICASLRLPSGDATAANSLLAHSPSPPSSTLVAQPSESPPPLHIALPMHAAIGHHAQVGVAGIASGVVSPAGGAERADVGTIDGDDDEAAVDTMEKAVLDAFSTTGGGSKATRKVLKRPAAASGSKATRKVLKRPTAATPLKRKPAKLDLKALWEELRSKAEDPGQSKNNIGSRAYHVTKRLALNAGWSEADSLEKASVEARKARALLDR